MIEVREINDIDQLAAFRSAWHALLAKTSGATFFQTLEWLECYWKHFGPAQRLRVLVVDNARRPMGILPLVVRPEATRVGQVRVLTYPLHDWSSFFGPIGSCAEAILAAGLRHVRRSPRDWDLLDLRWIDADGEDRGATRRAMDAAGLRPCEQKWDRTSLVELKGSWMEYWGGRDVKFRKNIDRLESRMHESGKVEFVRVRADTWPGGAPNWDLYDACVALAQRSWQGADGDPTNLCHDAVGAFFRDTHAAAAAAGAADINLLSIDGQPAAFAYNYCWNGAVYGLRKGFDPRLAALRPGLVLQKLMLEDGARRGDRLYDLGTGGSHGKAAWRTSERASYRFTHFPATVLRAQLLWWNRWLRRRLHGERDIACLQVV